MSTEPSHSNQTDNEFLEHSECPPEYTAAAPVAVNNNDDDEDYYSDDSEPDPEERRLMPLYLRRREEIERGRSSKAMRWLGIV
jgi:hypothetical protein